MLIFYVKASQNLHYSFIGENKDNITEKLSHNGFIQQTAAGIFHILPIGTRVIQNIEKIIREELDAIGCSEVMMSIMQLQSLWARGGRAQGYDDETMRVYDRNNKEFFLAPTAEEAAVEIVERFINSYKQLPITIYQIGKKYRDDLRPRFGMIRCREFIMKDAYSFDMTKQDAIDTFVKIYNSYINIFKRMGLKPIPVKADTGLIGGDLSYEIVVLAPFGENTVYYNHTEYSQVCSLAELENNSSSFTKSDNFQHESRCIELGHIYYLGQKYSNTMNAMFTDKNNEKKPFEMGCYGIGVTRLLGTIKAINEYWSYETTPFQVYLIGDDNPHNNNLYREIEKKYTVYFDNRDKGFGYKKKDAYEMGIPITVVNGKTLQIAYKGNNIEIQPNSLNQYIEKYIDDWKNNQ